MTASFPYRLVEGEDKSKKSSRKPTSRKPILNIFSREKEKKKKKEMEEALLPRKTAPPFWKRAKVCSLFFSLSLS
jgi:hypothetical protein